ncbi:ABC transporter ATP-binding protein [Salinibacter ruber]|uniref:ATP-binding cassette subfamily C protein n=1 Tax=Salinibacter ruber TaxID=146919 RepID=A0A9X2U6V1_9BACT|nr:ABC transporter ATP-binding protein [Salinibacter ruber]MCS3950925.1 ATP-binding cassette subfamily C protein [Salinibacter ruber]
MDIIKTLFGLLTSRERRNLYLLFCAVLMMAGLEVVSVASIMPFLSVAANPESVYENIYLSKTYDVLGFEEINLFLIFLGVAALIILVVSNAFIVFTTWALQRYAWDRNHSLSRRLLGSYLNQPYEYFLTRNSAELGKNVLQEVKEVINGMLIPGLRGLAKGTVALFIVGLLLFIDPVVALSVTVVLGAAYAGIYFAVKNRIDMYGERRIEENTKRYQSVNEVFGGIKEVKLRGKENVFLEDYSEASQRYSRYLARYLVVKKVPRYALEAVAFGGIILIAIYLIIIRENIQQVIPMLGLYAFAGYRLMPALQNTFKGIAGARFNIAALEVLERDLKTKRSWEERPAPWVPSNGTEEKKENLLTIDDCLTLDAVNYTYPDAEEPAIKDLSLEIPAQTTVGFVGKTGSGKTTTVDLILGLLRPQKGAIRVDNTLLQSENLRQWQSDIGYVPQHIYLSDDTVERNIAFGVPANEIDEDAVREAARKAHIYDFVATELPEQWKTEVGERGVKLSGGQRQRLGIARALYHNPSVLVFDEATSALDQATESRVMEAIYGLEGSHTMLMIAHRLSTVQRAEKIVMLQGGEKVAEGSYNEVCKASEEFRKVTRQTKL